MGEVSIWTWILIGSAALIMAGTLIRLAIRLARIVLIVGVVVWLGSYVLSWTESGREFVETARANVLDGYERVAPWVQAQLSNAE